MQITANPYANSPVSPPPPPTQDSTESIGISIRDTFACEPCRLPEAYSVKSMVWDCDSSKVRLDIEHPETTDPGQFLAEWNGMYLESIPCQAEIYLCWTGTGDPTGGLVQRSIELDLSSSPKTH